MARHRKLNRGNVAGARRQRHAEYAFLQVDEDKRGGAEIEIFHVGAFLRKRRETARRLFARQGDALRCVNVYMRIASQMDI